MKKLVVISIVFYALFFTSCQKSFSVINISNGVDSTVIPTGSVLVKTVTASNTNYTDTTVTEYSYDNNNKLVGLTQNTRLVDSATGTVHKFFYFQNYLRDTLGRVVKYFSGGRSIDQTNINDTFYIDYYYIDSTSPLVAYEKPGGVDSNAYIRNATGQVIKIKEYGKAADTMQVIGHCEFTYDGNNNVTQIKVFGFSDGDGFHPESLAFTYNYQYDDKINPCYTSDDMMPQWVWVDPNKMHNNAVLYAQTTNADSEPSLELVQNDVRVYTYSACKRPSTSTRHLYDTPDVAQRQQFKTTYFYK